jgi:hypothetical protein
MIEYGTYDNRVSTGHPVDTDGLPDIAKEEMNNISTGHPVDILLSTT